MAGLPVWVAWRLPFVLVFVTLSAKADTTGHPNPTPLDVCVEDVILAPIDVTEGIVIKGEVQTVITSVDRYAELGGITSEVNLTALLDTMQSSKNASCSCNTPVDGDPKLAVIKCGSQACVKVLLMQYVKSYISDLDGDGRVTCDDAAILLYVGHQYSGPTITIRCSLFWSIYRRNVAFLKHSRGVDVNALEIRTEGIEKEKPKNLMSFRKLDKDFFLCRNGQCKFSLGSGIERCDGVVDCADSSDEQDCEADGGCPEDSVTCVVAGVPTCLPETDFCRFHPQSCKYGNNTDVSLDWCVFNTTEEMFVECKYQLDHYFRTTFGEINGQPLESFREWMCQGNDLEQNLEPANWNASSTWSINMGFEKALQTIPPTIIDFKYLNYNQSRCQGKVGLPVCLFS